MMQIHQGAIQVDRDNAVFAMLGCSAWTFIKEVSNSLCSSCNQDLHCYRIPVVLAHSVHTYMQGSCSCMRVRDLPNASDYFYTVAKDNMRPLNQPVAQISVGQ